MNYTQEETSLIIQALQYGLDENSDNSTSKEIKEVQKLINKLIKRL